MLPLVPKSHMASITLWVKATVLKFSKWLQGNYPPPHPTSSLCSALSFCHTAWPLWAHSLLGTPYTPCWPHPPKPLLTPCMSHLFEVCSHVTQSSCLKLQSVPHPALPVPLTLSHLLLSMVLITLWHDTSLIIIVSCQALSHCSVPLCRLFKAGVLVHFVHW